MSRPSGQRFVVSGTGRAVLVLAAVAWGAAAAAHSPALAVLAAGLLGVVAVAVAWLVVPGVPAVVLEVRPPLVVRDGAAHLSVSARNRCRFRRTPALIGEVVAGRERIALRVPPLGPGAVHTDTLPVATDQRGVFAIGPLEAAQVDPFGVARRVLVLGGTSTLWVHPRRRLLRPAVSLAGVGAARVSLVPGMEEFHSLRPYQRGDDPRRIHWRSTARTLEPVVRHQVDPPPEPRLLGIADTAAWDRAAFEAALEYAAGLLEVVDGLITSAGRSVEVRGSAAAALRLLAGLDPAPPEAAVDDLARATIVFVPAGAPAVGEVSVAVGADGRARVRSRP